MGKISKKTKNDIDGQKYYWRFQSTVQKLYKQNKKCFICGTTKDLDIHHITQCKPYTENYYNPNNLVVICRECHRRYHHEYPDRVNVKTFMEYTKDRSLRKLQSRYDKLRIHSRERDRQLEILTEENRRIKQKLII